MKPDGKEIAFFRDGGLWKIDAGGGEAFPVCENCSGAFWANDGHIYFQRGYSVFRVSELGGGETLVLEPLPEQDLHAVAKFELLPGGKALLVESGFPGAFDGVSVIDIENRKVIKISNT